MDANGAPIYAPAAEAQAFQAAIEKYVSLPFRENGSNNVRSANIQNEHSQYF